MNPTNILTCKIKVTKDKIYPIQTFAFDDLKPTTDYLLYILMDETNFIYIGITKQKIQTRFGQSIYAYNNQDKKSKLNGYIGYKWIEDYSEKKKPLTLHLFEIGKSKTKNQSKKEKLNRKIFAETVEAELVFLVRTKKGSWPKYQHEIHFHNNPEIKVIAETIYKFIAQSSI